MQIGDLWQWSEEKYMLVLKIENMENPEGILAWFVTYLDMGKNSVVEIEYNSDTVFIDSITTLIRDGESLDINSMPGTIRAYS